MALGGLADFISFLIVDNPLGLTNRKAFNGDPDGIFNRFGVNGAGIEAFLSFKKEPVCVEVLRTLIRNGSQPQDVRAFSAWLEKFLAWPWPLGEEPEYGGKFCGQSMLSGRQLLYTLPQCEVHNAKVLSSAPNASDPMKRDVRVQIDGQGFLRNAAVQFMDVVTGALSPPKNGVDPDVGSTFRCGRITFDVTLPQGEYTPTISDQFNGANLPIGNTGVTFKVN